MSTGSNRRAKSLYGRSAAIVSGHHLATKAAESVLQDDGSLIDAMIAASAVLAVVLPHASSLGGCGMMLYFDAETSVTYALNGSGRAPIAANPEIFAAGMPQRGSRACLTPAMVRFWARAHERFGRLSWSSLFEAAIRYADEGVGCSEELARNLGLVDNIVGQQPGFRALFAPRGELLTRGEPFLQPGMARVLREIADKGENGFYQGWVAQSLITFIQANNGLITDDDLQAIDADWVETKQGSYRGAQIYVMPPNSVGRLMLSQLQLHEAKLVGSGNSCLVAEDILNGIAVIKDATQEKRNKELDPRYGEKGQEGLVAISQKMVSHKFSCEPGDTTGFVAMDGRGNAVSMLQSIFQPFGSGCADPRTGILLNNRMFDFSLDPNSCNLVASAARPTHTLNPYLVIEEGKAQLAGASPGGVSQTTTGFQIVSSVLSDPETASLGEIVSQARWSLGRDGTVLLEEGISTDVAVQLRAQGLRVIERSGHEFYFGSVKVVRANSNGLLEAVADQRRQAHPSAW